MHKGLIRRCKVMILASVAFMILIGLSMILFPGGNLVDRASIHFNFLSNYFSGLGATFTFSGKPNTASQILFSISMVIFGVAMVYFSKIWRAVDISVHESVFLGTLSEILLIVCGLSFAGLAFLPWNIQFENHVMLIRIAMTCLCGWYVLLIILESSNDKLKNSLVLNIIMALILIAYVGLLLSSDDFGKANNISIQAPAENLIMLMISVSFLMQSLGIMHFLRISDFRRSGMKNFYV